MRGPGGGRVSASSSRKRREEILGPEMVALIARAIAEAPPLSPAKFERLRRIFGPAAQRHRMRLTNDAQSDLVTSRAA